MAHHAGERSAFFITLFLFDILETILLKVPRAAHEDFGRRECPQYHILI